MIILSMFVIYFGIQIALAWKFIQKERAKSDTIIAQKDSFFRSSMYIFIAGFFIVIHELLDGFEKDMLDFVTYEVFELIALSGFALFLYEWHKILNKMKKKEFRPVARWELICKSYFSLSLSVSLSFTSTSTTDGSASVVISPRS